MAARLSELLTEDALVALRRALDVGKFPGVSLEHAILFLRSDGIVPASDLPVQSFIDLAAWIRAPRPPPPE